MSFALHGTVRTDAEHTAWVEEMIVGFTQDGATPEELADVRTKLDTRGSIKMDIEPITTAAQPNGYTEHRTEAPASWQERGISHVVLFEGPEKQTKHPFFFNGKAIRGDFEVVIYDAEFGKLIPLHCGRCAVIIAQWLANMQPEWKAVAEAGPAPKEATHVAPARLQ